jgi:excisionase family DNA binding protein
VKESDQPTAATRGEFLTARQLADVLQVSESTVRRLAREGRIPAIRITSRLLRFRLEAVLCALEESKPRARARRKSTAADGHDEAQLSFTEML